jgi:hypothetical protein
MDQPDYQAFLEVIPRFKWDKTTNDFVNFAQEKLGKIQGALTPTACLLLCGMHARGQGSSIPEFELIADRLTGFTDSSLFKEVSGRLAPLRSNAAVMTSKMVAVIEAAELIAAETKSPDSRIYPRHLVGAVLRYLLKTAAANERQSLNEIGIDHKSLIEKFLTVVLEEQKYPDSPKAWGKFLEPLGKTVSVKVSDRLGLGVSVAGRVETGAEAFANAHEAFDELLKKHQWSQSLRSLLGGMGPALNSRWEGGMRACLTPEALMLALLQFGKEHANDPNYVVAKLANLIALGSEGLRARFEAELDSSANLPDDQRTTSIVGARLSEVIATAEALAQKISRDRVVSVRHLAAALLLPPRGSAQVGANCVLPGDVFPAKEFARAFIEHVKTNVQDRAVDLDGGWDETVATLSKALETAERDWLVTLSADTDDGVDKLGIMPDVRALACVLSSKNLTPPLCVGLFGDWGTGKSFFMKKTEERVRWLTEKSKDALIHGRETAFCRSVAQITFNAWHYLDANLWASLACRIFEGLDEVLEKAGKSPEDAQTTKLQLFKHLETSKVRLKEAEKETQEANQAKEAAETELQDLQRQRREKAISLEQLKDKVVKDVLNENKDLNDSLTSAAKELGLSSLVVRGKGLEASLNDLQTAAGRGRALWLALAYGRDRWVRLLLLAAVLIVVPGLGVLIKAVLGQLRASGTLADAGAAVGQVTTAVILVGEWLRQNLRWATGIVEKVEAAHKKVEEKLAEAREKATPAEAQIQKDLVVLTQREAIAREMLKDAQEKVKQAEAQKKELEERANGKLVADFIRERVRSSAYQSQLGIISSIRKDLHSMSDLLRDAEKWQEVLGNAVKGGPASESPRIDRIILYIDDLDRCPEKTVVEVLQAVHLLLAFPLFVVVIGVDSRWLLQSLRCQYAALGDYNDRKAKSLSESVSSFASTPQHYLEKIIQVPFNLPPMDGDGFKQLLADVLPCETLNHTTAGASEYGRGISDEELRRRGAPAQAAAIESEAVVVPAVTTVSAEFRSSEEAAILEKPVLDLVPEVLKITAKELDFMGKLVSLIPTPRSAKRLGNVYRLLRAAIPQGDLPRFLGDLGSPAEFPTVITMLAIQTGFPLFAPALFAMFLEQKETWQEVQDALAAKVAGINKAKQDNPRDEIEAGYLKEEGERLCKVLGALCKEGVIGKFPASANKWVHKISRYSFRSIYSQVRAV